MSRVSITNHVLLRATSQFCSTVGEILLPNKVLVMHHNLSSLSLPYILWQIDCHQPLIAVLGLQMFSYSGWQDKVSLWENICPHTWRRKDLIICCLTVITHVLEALLCFAACACSS